ncbi:Phage-related protein [Brenneria goodwinii]|uniref:Phage-related protein n=1 Tax=Brenneria goodwinii TaxID=1109412 RepID=A0A0G4JWK1_9GAMM|nr:Phage-related protein [Brenneria goodwinii]
MIRLDRPNLGLSDLELIDRVVAERKGGIHRDYFLRIRDGWRERVARYIEVGGDPDRVGQWAEMADAAVHGRFNNLYLYPSEQSIQKPLLETLRNRELDYCPACGEDGTPNTLDHYLPKDLFPEFSITLVNLSPMCDICQGKKGTETVDDEGRRLFLHPYFDDFLDRQILRLEVGVPFNAPVSIALSPHPDIHRDLQDLVTRHLQGLDIQSRYYRYFQKAYIRLLRLVRKMREKDLDVRVQIEQFRDLALEKSINSWGHIFYEGVQHNEQLMEYLSKEDLPTL